MPRRAALLVALAAGCARPAPSAASGPPALGPSQAPAGFWEHWGDGQAEIAVYDLVQPRYGEERDGTAVLIFVTETFADGPRVKSDGGHRDEYPVLKLNEVRDFRTGLYDYNVMTSSFLRVDSGSPWGVPVKTSFSSQEWCGHVYEQLLPREAGIERTSHSYFDGEADRSDVLALPPRAVFADALPILVRGLVGQPGESIEVDLLDRHIDARFGHHDAVFHPATIRWGSPHATELTIGTVEVVDVAVDRETGIDITFTVEAAPPHRLFAWEASDGERATLRTVTRTPYWRQHSEADSPLRRTLLGIDDAP